MRCMLAVVHNARWLTAIRYHALPHAAIRSARALHVLIERFNTGGVTCGLFDYSTLRLTQSHAWPTSRNERLYDEMIMFIGAILIIFVKQLFDGLNTD